MFVTEATVRYCLSKWSSYSQNLENAPPQIKPELELTINCLADYHQLFHSIRWNRSRKQVKADIEQQLAEIAQQAYDQINAVGERLNHYADTQKVTAVKEFNQIVQLLQEAKMLVEIHHLSQKLTPIQSSPVKPAISNCIPGLEGY